jgi:hypothetical protein
MDSNLVWLNFVDTIPVIVCGCVLPIVFIWLETRRKINESRDRMQIITTAIEKHPDMDVEELMKKISPKKKSLKEKLLSKLLWGCITTILGIGLIGFGIFLINTISKDTQKIHMADDVQTAIAFGVVLLGIGIAFLINYGIGKKMLAKEIEAEEKNMTTQPKP